MLLLLHFFYYYFNIPLATRFAFGKTISGYTIANTRFSCLNDVFFINSKYYLIRFALHLTLLDLHKNFANYY